MFLFCICIYEHKCFTFGGWNYDPVLSFYHFHQLIKENKCESKSLMKNAYTLHPIFISFRLNGFQFHRTKIWSLHYQMVACYFTHFPLKNTDTRFTQQFTGTSYQLFVSFHHGNSFSLSSWHVQVHTQFESYRNICLIFTAKHRSRLNDILDLKLSLHASIIVVKLV